MRPVSLPSMTTEAPSGSVTSLTTAVDEAGDTAGSRPAAAPVAPAAVAPVAAGVPLPLHEDDGAEHGGHGNGGDRNPGREASAGLRGRRHVDAGAGERRARRVIVHGADAAPRRRAPAPLAPRRSPRG